MIPILYGPNSTSESDFLHNGLGFLTGAVKSQVTEGLNGVFELYVVYPTDGRLFSEVVTDAFIKASPNSVDEPHIFRIYECDVQSESNMVHIYAKSITFDLVGNMVMDVTIKDGTPTDAWNSLVANALDPVPFMFHSDITSKANAKWTRTNLLYCIAGEEGSMLQRWGGELRRGNFRMWLYRRRGRDNVTVIRHGKNLKGLTATYSTKGIVTGIIPVYTTYTEDAEERVDIVGDVVLSPLANSYPIIYYQEVIYTEEDDVTDLESLNKAAKTFFKDYPDYDKPSVNISVDMEDLSDSIDYQRFKHLENVEVGDTVTVFSERYNMNLVAKVQKLVYNSLLEKNEVIELGTTRAVAHDYYRSLVKETIRPMAETIQRVQISANGKNKTFRQIDEPTKGMQKGDSWYRPVGNGEKELYEYTGSMWKLEKVSAGLIAGTLDAENGDVNLINVNVANIVGEISEFVQTYWNNIAGGRIIINGDNFEGRDTEGNRSIINTSGQFRSVSGTDGRYGIFDKGRIWFYNEDGSAVLNIGSHPITGDDGLLKGVVATARAQRLILGRYNDYLTSDPTATVNPYISFEYGSTVGDEENVYIKHWHNADMNDKEIRNVHTVEGSDLALRSTYGRVLLGAPQPSGQKYNTLEVGYANTISNGSIDMKGYSITNQSDIRLKTNISDSELSALREIERIRFVEFDWDLTNPINGNKPAERQFGIIAQSAPFLQTKAADSESYLSIDMSKQANLNSKAIKELKGQNDQLRDELAELKSILTEKGLI